MSDVDDDPTRQRDDAVDQVRLLLVIVGARRGRVRRCSPAGQCTPHRPNDCAGDDVGSSGDREGRVRSVVPFGCGTAASPGRHARDMKARALLSRRHPSDADPRRSSGAARPRRKPPDGQAPGTPGRLRYALGWKLGPDATFARAEVAAQSCERRRSVGGYDRDSGEGCRSRGSAPSGVAWPSNARDVSPAGVVTTSASGGGWTASGFANRRVGGRYRRRFSSTIDEVTPCLTRREL